MFLRYASYLLVVLVLTTISPILWSGEIKVLTLNTWLLRLPFGLGGKDYYSRLYALPDKLAQSGADIIFLQETWKKKHRYYISREMQKRGYHAVYSHHKRCFLAMGDGLMILTKFPVVEDKEILVFPLNTFWYEVFSTKGGLSVPVEVPGLGKLWLNNTHLGSVKFDGKLGQFNPVHLQRKHRQIVSLLNFIDENAAPEYPAILAGDFNTHYEQLKDGSIVPIYSGDYLYITQHGWQDSFTGSDHPPHTWSSYNPYVGHGYGHHDEITFDYIFLRKNNLLTPKFSQVMFTEKDIISDHFGLMATVSY